MLGLKLPTDPRWATIVGSNIDEILTDHAWCEQKAVTNCISLIVHSPGMTEMVDTLVEIAQEELSHFSRVHEIIIARGKTLGPERKDEYVNDLYKFMKRGGGRINSLVDRLLFTALIEARSCERFRVLSENLLDEDLRLFYRDLMISEANHYTVFLGFAKKYGKDINVDKRWQEWLDHEASVIAGYGTKETIHG